MQISFTPQAKEDFEFWQKTGQKGIVNKILQLTNAIEQNPFEGIGKPEALKHNLAGRWSRRIDKEHRFVYRWEEGHLFILSLRGHY